MRPGTLLWPMPKAKLSGPKHSGNAVCNDEHVKYIHIWSFQVRHPVFQAFFKVPLELKGNLGKESAGQISPQWTFSCSDNCSSASVKTLSLWGWYNQQIRTIPKMFRKWVKFSRDSTRLLLRPCSLWNLLSHWLPFWLPADPQSQEVLTLLKYFLLSALYPWQIGRIINDPRGSIVFMPLGNNLVQSLQSLLQSSLLPKILCVTY